MNFLTRRSTAKELWWWGALADFMIANPTASLGDAAKFFNRAEATISHVRNSDGFRALLAQRRAESREYFDAAVQSKIAGVTMTALDAILMTLNKKKDTLPLESLRKVVETVNNVTGGQVKREPPPAVQVNVQQNNAVPVPVPVSMEDLTVARRAYRDHQNSLASQPAVEGRVVRSVGEGQNDPEGNAS